MSSVVVSVKEMNVKEKTVLASLRSGKAEREVVLYCNRPGIDLERFKEGDILKVYFWPEEVRDNRIKVMDMVPNT